MKRKKTRVRGTDPSKFEDSVLETMFRTNWVSLGYPPVWIEQHIFHPTRLWRFDFSIPSIKLAIEIQGLGPGHQSEKGMRNDYRKHNEAVRYGWIVLYLMGYQLKPGVIHRTLEYVYDTISARQAGLATGSGIIIKEKAKPEARQTNLTGIDLLRDKINRRSHHD